MAARECYLAMLAMDEHIQTMSIEERRVVAELIKVLEDIPSDENNLEKYTRVGVNIEKKTNNPPQGNSLPWLSAVGMIPPLQVM